MASKVYIPKTIYEPIIDIEDDVEVLNLEKVFKEPLKNIKAFIETKRKDELFKTQDFVQTIIGSLEVRDRMEFKSIASEGIFRFTDGTEFNPEKIILSIDDIKDLYEELLRRRYLDMKYHLDYIFDSLIYEHLSKGRKVHLGEVVLAMDIITYYKYANRVRSVVSMSDNYLNASYSQAMPDYFIEYKDEFIIDDPNNTKIMMETLLQDDEELGLSKRDRIRDLKYHKKRIKIMRPTLSLKVRQAVGSGNDDELVLMEGSDVTKTAYQMTAANIYKDLLSKGYMFDFHLKDVFAAIINELLWEIMLIYKCENPLKTMKENARPGDLVLMSLSPAYEIMAKVVYDKKNPRTYSTITILPHETIKEGKLLLDGMALSACKIDKIATNYSSMDISLTMQVAEKRVMNKTMNFKADDFFKRNIRATKNDEPSDIDSHVNFISANALQELQIILFGWEVDEMMHYPTPEFNVGFDKMPELEDFNPVPWRVVHGDVADHDMAYYHQYYNQMEM